MRIACAQAPVVFSDPFANASYAVSKLSDLKSQGVELVLFPECFLTGYGARSREEAREMAIERDHAAIDLLRETCDSLDLLAVMGFAESGGSEVYNTAVLFEPHQAPRFYRKSHLLCLGIDRFTTAGNELQVFDTRVGKLGILICFDMRPPEATRVLALKGAEVILLPTNWPVGSEVSADFVCVARASENKIFFAACNRIGVENGARYIGKSKIIGTGGKILASAEDEESVILADIDLAEARNKLTVNIPGEYELDVFASRRPSLYQPILAPLAE